LDDRAAQYFVTLTQATDFRDLYDLSQAGRLQRARWNRSTTSFAERKNDPQQDLQLPSPSRYG
jgi:hypothetical protein